MIRLLLVMFLLILSCGREEPPRQHPYETVTRQLRDDMQKASPLCQYSPDFKGISKRTCLAEGTGSGDADTMLFAGLLCLSGNELGCETVKRSVAGGGKPYRSPGRVNTDPDNTFSRDMFLGLMAYFIKTKDTTTALTFQNWLEGNANRLCFDSCDMRSTTWGLMGEVWKYLGLPLTLRMRSGMLVDDLAQRLAAEMNEKGYTQHLVATTIWLRQKINRYTVELASAANALADKSPANLFFAIIAGRRINPVCEVPAASSRMEWLWENAEKHAPNAVGWDCVLIFNILLGE